MARKLRDRIAEAAGLAMTGEPHVEIPAIDKTEALADQAKKGFDAINALFAERNATAELNDDLRQRLNHVQAINVGLREEVIYYKTQTDCLIKANARLGAYLAQMSDVFRRIAGETQQVNSMIESLPHPAPLSNNPDLPRVNSVMRRAAEEEPQFDDTGLPFNPASNGPPPVDAAELNRLVKRLNGADRQG